MATTTKLPLLFVVTFSLCIEPSHAWLTLRPNTPSSVLWVMSRQRVTPWKHHANGFSRLYAQKKKQKQDDEDDEEEDSTNSGVGMERAFLQLEQLSFLSTTDDENQQQLPDNTNTTVNAKIQASKEDIQQLTATASTANPTPEQEVLLYMNMVQELEETTEEDLYSNVLQDMGGSANSASSSSSNVILDTTNSIPTTNTNNPTTSAEFMNQALSEALQQVQINNPSAVDSILDDPELMNEIEAIFERGNAKLLEGLEAVRREQEQLTAASIQQAAQQDKQDDAEAQARLEAAERSIQTMLNRVNQERTNVEQAVYDLQRAQEEESSSGNLLLKLKRSPLKQGALIGFLLFTFRSLTDSFAVLNDPSQDWTVAVVQGAIALACAAVFYLL